jgi:hypothetical protein
VIGQANFTSNSSGVAANHFESVNGARGMFVYNNKLFVSDSGNNRILIFNSLPSSNGATADVVLGQPDFTSNTSNNGGVTCSALSTAEDMIVTNNGRLIVSDRHRILIFNSIPTTNKPTADFVIGQPNCFTKSANSQGLNSQSLSGNIRVGSEVNNKLVVTDSSNNRILIYDNSVLTPGINLTNDAVNLSDGKIRLNGSALASSPYTVNRVEYSINGGSRYGAAPSDGSYNSASENFSFDFDPKFNNLYPGYTVKVYSVNSNIDSSDSLFYFTPFSLNAPTNNSVVTESKPTFDFSVNTQKIVMRDGLSNYQILVKKTGTPDWKVYLDSIPVNFKVVKGSESNIYRAQYINQETDTGIYESDTMRVEFIEGGSRLKVHAKSSDSTDFDLGGKNLNGNYDWKIVAFDRAGHSQETDTWHIGINSAHVSTTSEFFPLVILNIMGIGNPNISTSNLKAMKKIYVIPAGPNTFYGIASVNARVNLNLREEVCLSLVFSECIHTYSTTVNPESRFGINIPKGILTVAKKYSVTISVSDGNKFNQLPQFILSVFGSSTAL